MCAEVADPAQLSVPLQPASSGRRDFGASLEIFKSFPYQMKPYAARNWGHPLHSLCSYASKMKPGLAHWLVELFTERGATVLDPFSGSGTIPFEACVQGRRGIGVDLSPLAHTITQAKVASPLREAVSDALTRLAAVLGDGSRRDELSELEEEIRDFFHPDTFTEIVTARRFLREALTSQGDDTLYFLSACLAHILHGNRPYALSRRSHGIIPIPPRGPVVYKPLMASLRDKARRMLKTPLPQTYISGSAYLTSANHMPLADDSVDAVITSPPFLGTTDFLRQNRLRLWFVGFGYEAQRERKPEFLEYTRDMGSYTPILKEIARVVRPGAPVVFHLGVVKGFDMAGAMTPLAEQVGFERIALVYEDATHLESHGRTDRGATAKHSFLFLKARA